MCLIQLFKLSNILISLLVDLSKVNPQQVIQSLYKAAAASQHSGQGSHHPCQATSQLPAALASLAPDVAAAAMAAAAGNYQPLLLMQYLAQTGQATPVQLQQLAAVHQAGPAAVAAAWQASAAAAARQAAAVAQLARSAADQTRKPAQVVASSHGRATESEVAVPEPAADTKSHQDAVEAGEPKLSESLAGYTLAYFFGEVV